MQRSFVGYLQNIFGSDFPNEYLMVAFNQDGNKCLAEVGDSVLDLVIKMVEYCRPGATPESIDKARQRYRSKKSLQIVLNREERCQRWT